MSITAAQVKELRTLSGAGMMECKKALQACDGDLEAAMDHLRKAGLSKAAKKSGRIAAEGLIIVRLNADSTEGVLVDVNCETDFVARDDSFVAFANAVGDLVLSEGIASLDALMEATLPSGETVEAARQQLVMTLGENITVRRLHRLSGEGLASYAHGTRIGVLVQVAPANETVARDIAMHVAAVNPVTVSPSDVPEEMVARERDIVTAQAAESGKPPEIIEKMVTGRMNKFVNEISLLGQNFVKDPNMTVAEWLKSHSVEARAFVRFEVGEGIEKEETDFRAEVMAQARGEA